MKKVLLSGLLFLLSIVPVLRAHEPSEGSIVGFWKTVNEETNKPESIVAVYEYKDRFFGRLIATFGPDGKVEETLANPKTRAPGIKGDPFYVGLDIIWNLQYDGKSYTEGKIVDPEQGKVYGAELWVHDGKLVVRGKILFLGRNQTWLPVLDSDLPPDFKKPNLAELVPQIPVVKGS